MKMLKFLEVEWARTVEEYAGFLQELSKDYIYDYINLSFSIHIHKDNEFLVFYFIGKIRPIYLSLLMFFMYASIT